MKAKKIFQSHKVWGQPIVFHWSAAATIIIVLTLIIIIIVTIIIIIIIIINSNIGNYTVVDVVVLELIIIIIIIITLITVITIINSILIYKYIYSESIFSILLLLEALLLDLAEYYKFPHYYFKPCEMLGF